MKRQTLYFTAPGRVECRDEELSALRPEELLVQTEVSAISAGTEMLLYRGEFPRNRSEDNDALSSSMSYPMPYGYAAAGRVVECGRLVGPEWRDRLVFAFHCHSSLFIARPETVHPVPDGLPADHAVFLPNMETAVNLVQDVAPIIGERVLVLGQGTVGLLSAALMHEFPLEALVTADRYERRRSASKHLGINTVFDASAQGFRDSALSETGATQPGYDACLEISGSPAALDDGIALTAFGGRIIVGSWYGEKKAAIDLGGRFHRSRIRVLASQVSTVAPELQPRWDKARRLRVAWSALGRIGPGQWITHRFALSRAAEAYRLLDASPEQTIQVVLTYE